MAKIGLFFGSSTGNTEYIAYQIKAALDEYQADMVEVHNIGATTPEQMLQYQYLIMGIPTWNTGELQDDWGFFFPKFEGMDFSGKKIAIFGLGDQNGYGFNFLDAVGMLADELLIRGAELLGVWKNEKYQFNESKAKIEEYFLGLGVDQDGQADMTSARIAEWSGLVKKEFGL